MTFERPVRLQLEIVDITSQLYDMNKIVTELEAEYKTYNGSNESLYQESGLLHILESSDEEEDEIPDDVRYEDDVKSHTDEWGVKKLYNLFFMFYLLVPE